MKVSLNWLKEFVDIDDIPVDKLLDDLTLAGLEVEDVLNQRAMYDKFIIGYVKETKKHENADKLTVCMVDTGDGEKQIICGAPNVAAGQTVPVALAGAVIPTNQMKIKKAKIRGVESNGMICAEDELGISDDHTGIMVLDDSHKPGTPLSSALGLDDVVFEIAITPNRPDALSQYGVARDVAAIYDRPLKKPVFSIPDSSKKIKDYAAIEIEDPDLCPRYSAKVVVGTKVQESPEWLKKRLVSVGLRPINNIVDATNYVLYELGQPLHAFDLNFLEENKIVVKRAKDKEKFVSLDSQERTLDDQMLMICDGKKAVAIAGVMGGENSEVIDETTDILIESAYFNPSSVRRTRNKLVMNTDASYRFERGTDPNMTVFAAERAAQIMVETGGGEIVDGTLDVYPKAIDMKSVSVRFSRTEKILGYPIPKEKIKAILEKLGLVITNQEDDSLELEVPTYRPDIEREIDVIEEIARIYGYDKIPTVERISNTLTQKVDESIYTDDIRDILTGLGFYEILCNSMVSEKDGNWNNAKPIKLLNPQTIEMEYLRTSMIPGALHIVKKNLHVGVRDLKLFELGQTFIKINDKLKSFDDFSEEGKLLLVLSGKSNQQEWYKKEEYYDFYHLKGYISELLRKKSLDNAVKDFYYPDTNNLFDYRIEYKVNKKIIGVAGKLRTDILKEYDINQDVFCCEISVNELKSVKTKDTKFRSLLRYPKVYKDFAFVFDKNIEYETIAEFIKKSASKLLKDVTLFDVFESESLGKSKRSLAISLEYYDESKTLTEKEVEEDFVKLIEAVKKEFNAVLRGS